MDEDHHCTRAFPKSYVAETEINVIGYPVYWRRDIGRKEVLKRGSKQYTVENTWVVPYNPVLSIMFENHVNVAYFGSMTSVKYVFEHVYKGHDCANV